MRTTALTSIIVVLCTIAGAAEQVISGFDGKLESVERMSSIIRDEAAAGATVVNFAGGRWSWHDLTRLDVPQKAVMSKIELLHESPDYDAAAKKLGSEE